MSQSKIDKFLEEVLSYIKFPFVKNDIRDELRSHILDKIDYYIENGYDENEAENLAIENMGDSKIIGRELNKQHNPFIGWFLKITNGFIIICTIIIAFNLSVNVLMGLFSNDSVRKISKNNIVYRLDIDEKVKIDDGTVHFTNLIYDKNGDMNIFYKYYESKLWGSGWSLATIGDISDDLGTDYISYTGSSSGGKSLLTIKDFSKKAHKLIIDYDFYNRKYRVEIPLKEGDNDE